MQFKSMRYVGYLPVILSIVSIALFGACTEVPTDSGSTLTNGPTAHESERAGSEKGGSVHEKASPRITFETLSYHGNDADSRAVLDLEVSGVDLVGITAPSDLSVHPADPATLRQLRFVSVDAGNGRFISGPGLIVVRPNGVRGVGQLVRVPVTGTRTTPQGVVEQVTGTVSIDLEEDVVEPPQGGFFSVCGDECVRFHIEATFREKAQGISPCLLTGTLTAESLAEGIPPPAD